MHATLGSWNHVGDFLFFLDDDSHPAPDWLDSLLKGFNDPHVGDISEPAYLDL